MRVVYFVSLFPCWSETFIVREIDELLKLGVDVRIVSLKHSSESLVQSDAAALLDRVVYPPSNVVSLREALRAFGRRPARELVDLSRIVGGLWRRPAALAKTLVVWWRLIGLLPRIQRLAPQHLHAHWATYPSTAAMLASSRLGVPFSFTAHAHDIFLEDQLLAEKLRRAAFGVTISDYNRRFLTEKLGSGAPARMRLVHCGVRPAAIAFDRAARSPSSLLAVGRLDEIKGFDVLVDACRLLLDRGLAFDCEVVGEGPLRPALEARIARLDLQRIVRLVGALPQEAVRERLSRAAAFVLPSVVTERGDRDGIPVALMEAMAAGLPIVSTRVSGIPELVEHEVNGLLAEPRDAEGLARCIERLLRHPEAADAMARRARMTIEREFDVATEARKLRDAFA